MFSTSEAGTEFNGGAVPLAGAVPDAGSVACIDPRTNQVTDTTRVGHRPQGVAVAGELVWASVRS